MVKTRDDAPVTVVEKCPVCGSFEVRVAEPDWFVPDLGRADDVRRAEASIEFLCRDCGQHWR
jgi:predicted RNA-binding Zn-ribbon protein involved in translation (DUF1610 family)